MNLTNSVILKTLTSANYLGIEMEPIDAIPVIEVIGSVVFTTSSHLLAVAGGVVLQSPNITGGIFSGNNRVLLFSKAY